MCSLTKALNPFLNPLFRGFNLFSLTSLTRFLTFHKAFIFLNFFNFFHQTKFLTSSVNHKKYSKAFFTI
ncbi:hypothetical protein EWZ98_03200 [Helicobacter pylori]|nr:hypothetical protein [Helicobacter pylori]